MFQQKSICKTLVTTVWCVPGKVLKCFEGLGHSEYADKVANEQLERKTDLCAAKLLDILAN